MRVSGSRATLLTAVGLGATAAVAWGLVLGPLRMSGVSGAGDMPGASMTVAPLLFMTTWLVMLLAMMLPAMTPMVVTYQRITAARPRGFVLPAVFVLGYLALWAVAGLVPLVFNLALPYLQMQLGTNGWSVLTALTLGAVGVYQLSPVKTTCLESCRSPLGFFIAHDFGAGRAAALRLGGLHGAICLGCCWALMGLMVVAGSMSAVWMAVLALIFIGEKSWRYGVALSRFVGAGSLAAAAALLISGWSL